MALRNRPLRVQPVSVEGSPELEVKPQPIPVQPDDSSSRVRPVLPEPAPAAEKPADLSKPIFPARFDFSAFDGVVAAEKTYFRRKEAKPGRAGDPQRVEVIKPSAAEPEDVIDADTGGIVVAKRSMRSAVMTWAQARAAEPGITVAEVAKRLGLAKSTLQVYIQRAKTAGWLRFEDPTLRMEYEIIPKVVENLNLLLDARDRTATIEAAKGTLFPVYRESHGAGEASQTVLALKIEQAPSDDTRVITGHIVGRSKAEED